MGFFTPRIGDAAQKLSGLEQLVQETRENIAQLKSERTGLGKVEQHLMNLNQQVDTKFETLKAVASAQTQSAPKDDKHINPQTREQVRSLKRQGWKNAEIANALKIPESVVELILELGIE